MSKLLDKFLKRLILHKGHEENYKVLSAIAVEIAINSPRVYNQVISIVSHFISRLGSDQGREEIVKNIFQKCNRLPNVGYLQIWLQRITYKMNADMGYTEPLCKIVNDEPGISLWNNDWLKDDLVKGFPTYDIKTNWLVDLFTPIISADEVSMFSY